MTKPGKDLYDYAVGLIDEAGIPLAPAARAGNKRVKNYEYPDLIKSKDGKLFGFTMVLQPVNIRRGFQPRSSIKVSIVEWFNGNSHSICDVMVSASENDYKKSYVLKQVVYAYKKLAASKHWVQKL